jgi:FKBP-type peptidyl-prolyl cis-trans isomerase SlyD
MSTAPSAPSEAPAIADKTAVTIAYTLKDDADKVLDSSEGKDPLTYLHGTGNIVPGLEKALTGKKTGDVVKVSLPAGEAYGPRDDKRVRNVPLRKLPDGKVVAGMRYRVQTDHGPIAALVTAVKGDYATVDMNHPFAGMTLHFEVTVLGVREATAEELEHRHVHGAGGHHH